MLVPIDTGTVPNWNTQVENPELFNMFVTGDGQLTYTPGLELVYADANCRAMWQTPYDGGAFILVSDEEIIRVQKNGARKNLYGIINTGQTVDITENERGQVTVVDGENIYVIDQANLDTVTVLTASQGIDFKNPISCCMINSFTVIIDGNTGYWQISDANNATSYLDYATAVQVISASLFKAKAVRSINNSLYIIGLQGIERWEPALGTNIYLYPLQKDMLFKIDFGAISTASVVANVNTIYFLSNRYVPMMLTGQGFGELLPPVGDKNHGDESGIARELANYPDVEDVIGCFYSFRGNFFYQMTFTESQKTWVFCTNSKTFSNTDDYIIGSAFGSEYVILNDGLYSLSLTPAHKKRMWTGSDVEAYPGQQNFRNLVSGVEVRMTQGSFQDEDVGIMHFESSIDRRTFLSEIMVPMGGIGDFNARTICRMNLACQWYRPRITYYGTYPLTIEAVDVSFQQAT